MWTSELWKDCSHNGPAGGKTFAQSPVFAVSSAGQVYFGSIQLFVKVWAFAMGCVYTCRIEDICSGYAPETTWREYDSLQYRPSMLFPFFEVSLAL